MKKILLLTLATALLVSCSSDDSFVVKHVCKDGSTIVTAGIQKVIDACYEAGGGVVSLPKGDYLVGTLNLRDNVEFHFENGARLIASTDTTQYQKHNEQKAGVFYTEDCDNVSITGNGTIFGNGMAFMTDEVKPSLNDNVINYSRQGDKYKSGFEGVGDGPVLADERRFHQMLVFSNCTNVLLRDFTCIDSPYWCFVIVHCDRVVIEHLHIDNNLLIPNSDGIDIISTSNVTVSDCDITCGDDAIILAGYQWHYGDPGFKRIERPVKNININNCNLRSRSSAIRIGGWDQNQMSDFNLSNINIYDSNCGIGLCIRDTAGVSNLNFTNFNIHTRIHSSGDWWGNGEPIKITAMRDKPGSKPGKVSNLHFSNINTYGENSIIVWSDDDAEIDGIYFDNFDFNLSQSPYNATVGGNFDFRPTGHPELEIFKHTTPVVCIHGAKNVRFTNGTMTMDETCVDDNFAGIFESENAAVSLKDVSQIRK